MPWAPTSGAFDATPVAELLNAKVHRRLRSLWIGDVDESIVDVHRARACPRLQRLVVGEPLTARAAPRRRAVRAAAERLRPGHRRALRRGAADRSAGRAGRRRRAPPRGSRPGRRRRRAAPARVPQRARRHAAGADELHLATARAALPAEARAHRGTPRPGEKTLVERTFAALGSTEALCGCRAPMEGKGVLFVRTTWMKADTFSEYQLNCLTPPDEALVGAGPRMPRGHAGVGLIFRHTCEARWRTSLRAAGVPVAWRGRLQPRS